MESSWWEWMDSLDLDDDLALGAAGFDVRHGFVGRFERKDAVDDRTDRAGIEQARDLAQLASVRPHEEERVAHSLRRRLAPRAEAQKPHDEFHESGRADLRAEGRVGRAGNRNERA